MPMSPTMGRIYFSHQVRHGRYMSYFSLSTTYHLSMSKKRRMGRFGAGSSFYPVFGNGELGFALLSGLGLGK
jgi:hypothetical protein